MYGFYCIAIIEYMLARKNCLIIPIYFLLMTITTMKREDFNEKYDKKGRAWVYTKINKRNKKTTN